MKTDLEPNPVALAGSIPSWIVRKMNRMTILVGMVGSDGIVLAGDTKAVEFAQTETQIDNCTNIYKIIYETPGIAYAFAGDWMSQAVGSEIELRIRGKTFKFTSIKSSLEEAANDRAWTIGSDRLTDGRKRSLLIAFYGPDVPIPQLWRLDIQSRPNCVASRVETIEIPGALGNLARFFGTYYETGLSVERLKFLAAHIVLTANRVDKIIEGLHMVVCDKEHGVRWVEDAEKEILRARSRALEDSIRMEFHASSSASSQT